ncbi:hypothetical protein C0Z18_26390 [Trinickia dabaoshanensis]|uniref:Uncharacterized protein n=1 Tax=Trinickia dabaoshanensis TaxID=564714 RepID=A0A2N7VEI8_9BURK|nr:hypothetical protein [Trinickia dabaoshanensis]PMS15560.1 hypothetical protein C0Z18_26390 [Trinickia dabaoshanensis]
MISNEKEQVHLAHAYDEARAFLAMSPHTQAQSAWLASIRDDRDTRKFFLGDAIRGSTGFAVAVAVLVAKAYVVCAESGEETPTPTIKQIEGLKASASVLELKLGAAEWVVPEARRPEFREPLRRLASAPSALAPRAAGRPPLLKRRQFVLSLAESLYELSATFDIKLLMIAAIKGWEDTGERQIRDILTETVRSSIVSAVRARRARQIESENATFALLNRVSVGPQSQAEAKRTDTRSDAEKIVAGLELFRSLTDPTASILIVDAVRGIAEELGLLPDAQADGDGGNGSVSE